MHGLSVMKDCKFAKPLTGISRLCSSLPGNVIYKIIFSWNFLPLFHRYALVSLGQSVCSWWYRVSSRSLVQPMWWNPTNLSLPVHKFFCFLRVILPIALMFLFRLLSQWAEEENEGWEEGQREGGKGEGCSGCSCCPARKSRQRQDGRRICWPQRKTTLLPLCVHHFSSSLLHLVLLQEYYKLRLEHVRSLKEQRESPYPHKFHVGMSLEQYIKKFQEKAQPGVVDTTNLVSVSGNYICIIQRPFSITYNAAVYSGLLQYKNF